MPFSFPLWTGDELESALREVEECETDDLEENESVETGGEAGAGGIELKSTFARPLSLGRLVDMSGVETVGGVYERCDGAGVGRIGA